MNSDKPKSSTDKFIKVITYVGITIFLSISIFFGLKGVFSHRGKEKSFDIKLTHKNLLYLMVVNTQLLNEYYNICFTTDDYNSNKFKEFDKIAYSFDSMLTKVPKEDIDSIKSFDQLLIQRTIRIEKDLVDYWSEVQKRNGYPFPFIMSDSTNLLTKKIMVGYDFKNAILLDSTTRDIDKNNIFLHNPDDEARTLSELTKVMSKSLPDSDLNQTKFKLQDSDVINKIKIYKEGVTIYNLWQNIKFFNFFCLFNKS